MARQLDAVLEHIRGLAANNKNKTLTDGELLDQFSGYRDQAAFAALVQRHPPPYLVIQVLGRIGQEIPKMSTYPLFNCGH